MKTPVTPARSTTPNPTKDLGKTLITEYEAPSHFSEKIRAKVIETLGVEENFFSYRDPVSTFFQDVEKGCSSRVRITLRHKGNENHFFKFDKESGKLSHRVDGVGRYKKLNF